MKLILGVLAIIFIYLWFGGSEGYVNFPLSYSKTEYTDWNRLDTKDPDEMSCGTGECSREKSKEVRNPHVDNYFGEFVVEPTYLKDTNYPMESEAYKEAIINKQTDEIRRLRTKMRRLAERIDDQNNQFYRRKLSNKNYKPKPFLAHTDHEVLNLYDDDFSTKTLSTIKFLAQTRSSKYYGDSIHFPTELCGHYCSTEDPNAKFHEQLDIVRPITPSNFAPRVK